MPANVVQNLYVLCVCLFHCASETRYMRIRAPYMARGRGQLTIPGGATVFLFDEVDKDGMATVIYDGQVSEANFFNLHSSGRKYHSFVSFYLSPLIGK